MRRAIEEPGGHVEVLGGFAPAEGFPYWALTITSKHDRVWHVRVIADEQTHAFRIVRADRVDWQDWIGGDFHNALWDGDHPEVYYARRQRSRPSSDQ
jgi:hypothetical protein